jgi:16S rRNA processing protein RimM
MAYKCDILLGKITKVSGYEGAVAIKLEKNFTDNIPGMESVFLEIEGRPVPFFITDIEYSGADVLKLQFDGYDSNEKIAEFLGCRVFLTSTGVELKIKEDTESLIGYKVIDQDARLLGSVSDVISNSGQWLLTVMSEDKKQILIPFHEDFISGIDRKTKVINMDIPEGLTEIN